MYMYLGFQYIFSWENFPFPAQLKRTEIGSTEQRNEIAFTGGEAVT